VDEKLNRLPLQAIANSSLKIEHRPRATPERAVVQKINFWIEQPQPRITRRPVQETIALFPCHIRAKGPL